ncbi:structural maintenance of chromosomes protein 2 [Elysia marginata]|uniref:Structural maintenance of chromosomes protein 2 n=1 Tax=Elysia marginata TaxID=1093978 RepID=A0AAV4J642_9GAST|nr:structural maintenance of chromosomes protein 2 [Elysia marginata]
MLGQLRQEEQAFASKSGHLEKLDKELTAVKKSAAKCSNSGNEHAPPEREEQNNILQGAKETQKKAQEKVKDLEDKLKNATALREKELKEADKKVSDCKKAMEDAAAKSKDHLEVESLLEKYDWIADEKKYFGQPNTVYDFNEQDPKEAEKRIQKLTETKNKLSKNVNVRAMNLLGSAEEQYAELMKKRKVVLNDKAKIASVIEELDKKKEAALLKAWEQVNKDFGSIFSTLLPGTQAKLSPPDGQTVLDGLEVKVGFGSVWKESLGELSGGQRSLVALSLILAMLLFKPAPIYILDEVDAALDLSHTQNIGQMIKSHFKHSQFIVVSLKDGMFNNANVLFRTKFVDGVSTVTRHVQLHNKALTSTEDKENEGRKKQKKR